MYVASYVGEGKVCDTSLAFGAETGEVSDEALPKEIILLYLTGLRRFCLAGQDLPRITNLLEKSSAWAVNFPLNPHLDFQSDSSQTL